MTTPLNMRVNVRATATATIKFSIFHKCRKPRGGSFKGVQSYQVSRTVPGMQYQVPGSVYINNSTHPTSHHFKLILASVADAL